MKNDSDVIVIGGGAAGLTAALSVSNAGGRALILESAPRIGRKILASGNGRCNLANAGDMRYYGGADLAAQVLAARPAENVLSFFRGLGLQTVLETGGRVYPACGQAAAVLDVLRYALERNRVRVVLDAGVNTLKKKDGGFIASTPQGDFSAFAAVVCCGGMAGGRLGHDGGPYRLLTQFGHTLKPPRPALTQLTAEKKAVRGLSGLRLPALLTLCQNDTPVEASQGEALFTDYGVSGVCAMQLSRKAGEMLEKGEKPILYMDFSPMLGLIPRIYDRVPARDPFAHVPMVEACLSQRQHILPREALLTGLCPRLLAERVLSASLSVGETARLLSAFPVPIVGVRGMENAQVTCGGIDTGEFDGRTLMSKRCPGLFAAGEILDVDGDCGGYNLLFAFASGLTAGESAARWMARR